MLRFTIYYNELAYVPDGLAWVFVAERVGDALH
jgi:hypothetical protein